MPTVVHRAPCIVNAAIVAILTFMNLRLIVTPDRFSNDRALAVVEDLILSPHQTWRRDRSDAGRDVNNRSGDIVGAMAKHEDEFRTNGTQGRRIVKQWNDSDPGRPGGAFVHVGKTGGSSLTRVLRNACHSFVLHPCSIISNETIVSKQVDHYFHVVDFDRLYRSRDKRFIISIRDAYERTVSAFAYHHPANVRRYRPRLLRGRRERLLAPRAYGTCFSRSLDDFAKRSWTRENDTSSESAASANDLCHYRPPPSGGPHDVNDSDCAALACAAARGNVKFFHHLYYNYQFMIRSGVIINDGLDGSGYPTTNQNSKKDVELFSIRNTNLWEDWYNINLLWGETEMPTKASPKASLRNVTSLGLPIHKGQITAKGRRRLCRAIEPEYRAYFRILRASINLQMDPVAMSSARELAQKYCPQLSDWALLRDNVNHNVV